MGPDTAYVEGLQSDGKENAEGMGQSLGLPPTGGCGGGGGVAGGGDLRLLPPEHHGSIYCD